MDIDSKLSKAVEEAVERTKLQREDVQEMLRRSADEATATAAEQVRMWESFATADKDIPLTWERHVAETLRQLREDRGWSQSFTVEQLAKQWGIEMHQTTLAKLESGKRPLRLSELFALATVYDLDVMTVLSLQPREASLPGETELRDRYVAAKRDLDQSRKYAMDFLDATINVLAKQQAATDLMSRALEESAKHRGKAARNREVHGEHQEAP